MDLPKLKAEILRFERLDGGGRKNLPLRRWYNHVAEMKGGEKPIISNYKEHGLYVTPPFNLLDPSTWTEEDTETQLTKATTILRTLQTCRKLEKEDVSENLRDFYDEVQTMYPAHRRVILDKESGTRANYDALLPVWTEALMREHGISNESSQYRIVTPTGLVVDWHPKNVEVYMTNYPNHTDTSRIEKKWKDIWIVDLNEVKRKLGLLK